MDQYIEQVLKAKPNLGRRFWLFASVALIVVGAFLVFCVDGTMGITVIIVGAFFTGVSANMQKIEYEYCFTNGDCDIARITNKSSRKSVYSFSEGDVLRILPYTSEKLQNELSVNNKLAVKSFTSGGSDREKAWFAFFVSASGVTTAVILELNEKTYNYVKDYYKTKYEGK